MSRDQTEVLIRRLRAHGKLPGDTPVHVQSVSSRPDGTRTAWRVLSAATGEPVGVESRHSIAAMLAARQWTFRLDGDVTVVAPAGPETPGEAS